MQKDNEAFLTGFLLSQECLPLHVVSRGYDGFTSQIMVLRTQKHAVSLAHPLWAVDTVQIRSRRICLDHDGMVQQAVQQGGGHDDVTKDSSPVPEAAIGGEDGGALLVAGIDQLEEQVGAAGFDRQVADLIDDEQASDYFERL